MNWVLLDRTLSLSTIPSGLHRSCHASEKAAELQSYYFRALHKCHLLCGLLSITDRTSRFSTASVIRHVGSATLYHTEWGHVGPQPVGLPRPTLSSPASATPTAIRGVCSHQHLRQWRYVGRKQSRTCHPRGSSGTGRKPLSTLEAPSVRVYVGGQ